MSNVNLDPLTHVDPNKALKPQTPPNPKPDPGLYYVNLDPS